jgi:hypothetical protein
LQTWAATSPFGKKIDRIIEIGGQSAPSTSQQEMHERALTLKNEYERVGALPKWKQVLSLLRLFDATEKFHRDYPDADPAP